MQPKSRLAVSPYGPVFSYRVSQIKHRVLVNLYGHTSVDRQSLFSYEKRETITIPKVKADAELRDRSKSPQVTVDSPIQRPVLALPTPTTPKSDIKTPPSVSFINFSDLMHASERSISSAKKCFTPKRVFVHGTKSHINRAEKRYQVNWLVAGRSAFAGTEGGLEEASEDRLNKTMPNIVFSDVEETVRTPQKGRGEAGRGTSSGSGEEVGGRSVRDPDKRVLSSSRSRADSATTRSKLGTQPDPDDRKVHVSPPQVIFDPQPRPATAVQHDRTTSMSFDFNENWKLSRVLPLNKVDIGKVLTTEPAKGGEKHRKRPASAKYVGKRTVL